MAEIDVEIAAYERVRDSLEKDHFGKWVIFHDEKFIGAFDDFEEAAQTAVVRFGRGPYLIKQVGEPPRIVPIPVLYG